MSKSFHLNTIQPRLRLVVAKWLDEEREMTFRLKRLSLILYRYSTTKRDGKLTLVTLGDTTLPDIIIDQKRMQGFDTFGTRYGPRRIATQAKMERL